MKCIAFALLILGTAGIPSSAQLPHPDNVRLRPRWQPKPTIPTVHMSPLVHRRPVAQNVTWSQCPPEAENFGASCGYALVPLDRRHPHGQQIGIYFELYGHLNSGAAESAILVNFGGPGSGTTTNRDLALSLFAPNLDAHDLLLVDDRGRGLSNTIDCEELQHGTAPPLQHEIADCATRSRRDVTPSHA